MASTNNLDAESPVLVQSQLAMGRAIRDARRTRRLTQLQLAEISGVAQPTLSNVERGVSRISLDTLLRILAALQLELLLQPREAGEPVDGWLDQA